MTPSSRSSVLQHLQRVTPILHGTAVFHPRVPPILSDYSTTHVSYYFHIFPPGSLNKSCSHISMLFLRLEYPPLHIISPATHLPNNKRRGSYYSLENSRQRPQCVPLHGWAAEGLLNSYTLTLVGESGSPQRTGISSRTGSVNISTSLLPGGITGHYMLNKLFRNSPGM